MNVLIRCFREWTCLKWLLGGRDHQRDWHHVDARWYLRTFGKGVGWYGSFLAQVETVGSAYVNQEIDDSYQGLGDKRSLFLAKKKEKVPGPDPVWTCIRHTVSESNSWSHAIIWGCSFSNCHVSKEKIAKLKEQQWGLSLISSDAPDPKNWNSIEQYTLLTASCFVTFWTDIFAFHGAGE